MPRLPDRGSKRHEHNVEGVNGFHPAAQSRQDHRRREKPKEPFASSGVFLVQGLFQGMPSFSRDADFSFLAGGGEMVGLIAACDWQASPLGPLQDWSAALRATVGLILPARAEIVMFWGSDYVAIYNDAYAPTIGNKHPHALGRPGREYWTELWDDLEPLLRGVRESGKTFSAKDRPFYIERHGVGETVYFDVSYSAVREADGSVGGVLCIVSETTARVRAQQQIADINATLESRVNERTRQLLQTEEALRQSQKMDAVGQLTGGLAHDFNNLLQGIVGSLDRVQTRLARGRLADIDRFLKSAFESANRAAALTNRLLAFSRRQALDPRPADLNHLVASMEDLIRRTMGPPIDVEVVRAHDLWAAKVDLPQLESALLNLCINARDAMPEGGSLTIETTNAWLDEHAARLRDLPPGEYVALSVSDTGAGMTPEVRARAFDPFFTTKPLGQGTGLGLSMVYGFVQQSGGQVRIYSEVGRGTSVSLYLPHYVGSVDEQLVAQQRETDGGLGETVLVVDDEATVRMLVNEVLTEQFYNILEATDGRSALNHLEADRRIDLLITDVGLPGGMNGRQVADAARVHRPDLKVLFITGYAENAAIKKWQLEPGMAVLRKPFAMATLENKVREMLES
jgi:signal transduction histidine kinase